MGGGGGGGAATMLDKIYMLLDTYAPFKRVNKYKIMVSLGFIGPP